MRAGGVAHARVDRHREPGPRGPVGPREVRGVQQQLTSKGSHSLTAVVLNPTGDGVVLSTDYGTQYDVRGHLVAVP